MKIICKIDAVHDIQRRVVKSRLGLEEANTLCSELLEHGYEKENIKLDINHFIFEDGDTFFIPKEDYESLSPTNKDHDKLKSFLDYIVREKIIHYQDKMEFPLLFRVKQKTVYLSDMDIMIAYSEDVKDKKNFTVPVEIFECLGFEFDKPLTPKQEYGMDEDIIQDIMKIKKCSYHDAMNHLKPIYKMMADKNLKFKP